MLIAADAVPSRAVAGSRNLCRDHAHKHFADPADRLPAARISPFVYQQVRRLALAAHRAPERRGVSDFRWGDAAEGTAGLLDVNTQGGMTETSPTSEIAADAGIPFVELVGWKVEDACLER
jgi:D-alanine-D-alanine ligase